MIANYHTHTHRCGHAVGAEEAYVCNAIEAGLKILGFSDHTPYPFRNGYCSRIRMGVEEFPEYAQKVGALKEKYADKIQIHLGVEAEYYPQLFPELLDILREQNTEYLILGQHYLYEEEQRIYAGTATDDESKLRQYCDQAIAGLYTGMFSCLVHPDLMHYLGNADIYRSHMRRLCRAAKDCDIPLEMNLLGIQSKRNYPSERFWEIAAEEGCSVILGVDAHQPEAFLDTQALQVGESLISQFGLTKIDTLSFHSIT